jgi:TDG/mug DNA glycosylase family protein
MNEGEPRLLPDVVAPGLQAIFCGLNPGKRAAASGHHFDGRGNRFWPVLHRAGFTPRLLAPHEDRALLDCGYGLTTAVERASAGAGELARAEWLGRRMGLPRATSSRDGWRGCARAASRSSARRRTRR